MIGSIELGEDMVTLLSTNPLRVRPLCETLTREGALVARLLRSDVKGRPGLTGVAPQSPPSFFMQMSKYREAVRQIRSSEADALQSRTIAETSWQFDMRLLVSMARTIGL